MDSKYYASGLLVFMGSMDCLTTAVGSLYFGTQELNPLIAELVASNLPAFVVIKLAVTFFVGAVFVLAERMVNGNKEEKSFQLARNTLKAAYIGITLFLVAVVTNNVVVLLKSLFV